MEYSEPYQVSRIECFKKIIFGWTPLIIFAKSCNLRIWQVSEYASIFWNTEIYERWHLSVFGPYTGIVLIRSKPYGFCPVLSVGIVSANLMSITQTNLQTLLKCWRVWYFDFQFSGKILTTEIYYNSRTTSDIGIQCGS